MAFENEKHVNAPTGKQTFKGRVVSVKIQNGAYGTTLRMTVKVTTPAGTWLAWGTAPMGCLSESCNHGGLKGCDVEITATLKPGRDPHFAILSRPRGKVTRFGCADRHDTCAGCCDASRELCPALPPVEAVDHFAEFEKAGAA